MIGALPEEVWELICHHRAAGQIQRLFRCYKLRHTREQDWADLRRLLVLHGDSAELDNLTNNVLVRREWRSEPESWIKELQSNSSIIHLISAEVTQGFWDVLPTTG